MNQIQCPNCKSYKVTSNKTIGLILILGGLALGFLIFPLLFVPIGIVVILTNNQYTCLTCHFRFNPKKLKPKAS